MVKILRANSNFNVEGIEIEGFNDIGVDVSPVGEHPATLQDHPTAHQIVWIDKYPVTNAQFKKLLTRTLSSQDDLNFLRDWQNGKYPTAGITARDVDLDRDARAYAGLGWQSVSRTNGNGSTRLKYGWQKTYPWGTRGRQSVPTARQEPPMRGLTKAMRIRRAQARCCSGHGRKRLAVDGRV